MGSAQNTRWLNFWVYAKQHFSPRQLNMFKLNPIWWYQVVPNFQPQEQLSPRAMAFFFCSSSAREASARRSSSSRFFSRLGVRRVGMN
jgi:hypothetical protein